MSRDFSRIIQGAMGFNNTLLAPKGISLLTPVDARVGIKTLPIVIDWEVFGASTSNPDVAVAVNFSGGQSAPPLDVIKSIVVDNTFSLFPIYVYFADCQMTYVCPPNATLTTPVLTNGREAIIFAEGLQTGFTPRTTIHFTNAVLDPLVVSNPFAQPADIVFIGSGAVSLAVPQTSQTFLNVPIGAASPERIIACVFSSGRQNGAAPNAIPNAFTLNGTPMLATPAGATDALGLYNTIFYSPFPSGSFADFFMQWTQTIEFVSIAIYAIYNAQTPAPVGATVDVGALGSRQVSLNMPQGSVGLFSGLSSDAAAFPGVVWTGVSSVDFSNANALPPNYTIHQGATIAGQNVQSVRTVTANQAVSLVGAAWR